MNYLTNYYKNLSEQLQEKINLLESYLYDLNEGLEQEVIQQSSDFGAGAGTSTTSTNKPNNNSELNSFLQAWGTSNPNYDYNRDGVVDGDDLGVFLAGMLNRGGSSPVTMASTVAAATPRAETLGGGGAKTARAAKALDQPGLAKGSVNRMVDFGQGVGEVEKKNQTPRLVSPKIPYSTGTKQSKNRLNPTADTGLGFQNLNTQNTSNRVEQPPQTAMGTQGLPSGYGPDGYHLADFNKDGFVNADDQGQLLSAWGTSNPQFDINRDGFINADDQGELLAAWGERPFVDPNSGGGDEPPPPPQTNSESPRENIPYWMSGKTTELDTSFRSMQRRRRK